VQYCTAVCLCKCSTAQRCVCASAVLHSGASQWVHIKTFLLVKSGQIQTLLSPVWHCAPLSVLTGDGCTDRVYENGRAKII
jgi:hypothetical protein